MSRRWDGDASSPSSVFDDDDTELRRIAARRAAKDVAQSVAATVAQNAAGIAARNLRDAESCSHSPGQGLKAMPLDGSSSLNTCSASRHFSAWTRLYVGGGPGRATFAHLAMSANDGPLCGVELLAPYEWLGTGDQDEYERAASLPLCPGCTAMQ